MKTADLIQCTNDLDYCEKILLRVSRTFAINIQSLKTGPQALYQAVLCGYLFCRIIDTIEDSSALSFEEKIRLLGLWQSFFPFKGDWEKKLSDFIQGFDPSKKHTRNSDENELIQSSFRVFSVFKPLGKEVHDRVARWVNEMACGMGEYQKRGLGASSFPITLKDIKDLEQYCYYVAGTVGLMLRDLFFWFHPEISENSKTIMNENAVPFGLGLQMTNIIKDFYDDGEREWCFIPQDLLSSEGLTANDFLKPENASKAGRVLLKLVKEANGHLVKALAFSNALPGRQKHLRLFCLIPLHFAAETLESARQWACAPKPVKIKITRSQVMRTLLLTRLTYPFNFFQKGFFKYLTLRLEKNAHE